MQKKRILSILLTICLLFTPLTLIPSEISSMTATAAGGGADIFSALGVSTDPARLEDYDPSNESKAQRVFGQEGRALLEYNELYTVRKESTEVNAFVKGIGTGYYQDSNIPPNTIFRSEQETTEENPFDDDEVVRVSISFPIFVPSLSDPTKPGTEQAIAIVYATDDGLFLRIANPNRRSAV